jgi:O-antigen/teichoic acid export membrane protein
VTGTGTGRAASASGLVQFAVAAAVSVAQLGLLAHHLSVAEAGFWALALTLGNFLLFLDLGFGMTLLRELSFLRRDDGSFAGREAEAAAVFATCSRLTDLLAVLAFVVAAVAGSYVIAQLAPTAWPWEAVAGWMLFAAGTTASLKSITLYGALEGLGQVAGAKLSRAAAMLSGLAALGAALAISPRPLSVGIAYLLQGAALLVIVRVRLARTAPWLTRGRADPALRARLVRPTAAWALTSLGALLLFQSSNLVVATMLGIAEVPRLDALMRVGFALMAVSLVPALAGTAVQAAHFGAGRREALAALLGSNSAHAVRVMGCLAAAFALHHADIVTLWLGPAYVAPDAAVWALMLMFFLEAHHGSLAYVALAAGHTKFYVPALVAGVANVALAVALAPRLGLAGVAFALLASQLATNNWWVPYATLRVAGLPLRRYVAATLAPSLGFVALACAAQGAVWYLTREGERAERLAWGLAACALATLAAGAAAYLPRTRVTGAS